MPYLGIRATKELQSAVKDMAEKNKTSTSAIIRSAIESYVVDYITSEQVEWKIIIWTLFNVDTHKTNFALTRANTAAEFFSLLSKWVKGYSLGISVNEDEVTLSVQSDNRTFTVSAKTSLPKERIISDIMVRLESKYMEEIVGDI